MLGIREFLGMLEIQEMPEIPEILEGAEVQEPGVVEMLGIDLETVLLPVCRIDLVMVEIRRIR